MRAFFFLPSRFGRDSIFEGVEEMLFIPEDLPAQVSPETKVPPCP
jgi:hypothetical protein